MTISFLSKCVRKHCPRDGGLCVKQPKYLIFRNVTLTANMKLTNRGIVLHNIYTTRYKFPVEFAISSEMKSKDPKVVSGKTSDFG